MLVSRGFAFGSRELVNLMCRFFRSLGSPNWDRSLPLVRAAGELLSLLYDAPTMSKAKAKNGGETRIGEKASEATELP